MTVELETENKPAVEAVSSAGSAEPAFATPADLPSADVVIYDGECVFCKNSVKLLQKWVGKNQLSYISLHDEWVAENVPELTHEQLMDRVWLISREDGSKHGGAEMVRYLSTRTWKLWIAAPFMYFPGSMPLWQWMYQLVARRRYKIANKNGEPLCGEDGTCKLHYDK